MEQNSAVQVKSADTDADTLCSRDTNLSDSISGRAAHYFMSSNSPDGFVSWYDRLYKPEDGWRAYILKGAPGVAPSLLGRLGARLESAGIAAEYIHGAADSGEVEALSLPSLKTCIIDGMPPHTVVPSFPGIVEEEISLCTLDGEQLCGKLNEVLQFTQRGTAIYDRACRFISAAASLETDTFRIAAECTDIEAAEKYTTRLAKRLFEPTDSVGHDSKRFLSAITSDGIVCYSDNVIRTCAHVFIIEDDYGVSRLLLSALREKALAAGYDTVSCSCPLYPNEKPEHLLIPALSLAFITSNRFHRADGKACRHINVKRFMDCDSLRLKRARIGFNRRAVRELINQAALLLREARADEAIVRACYTPAVDFGAAQAAIDALAERIIAGQQGAK